jgi:hypothetical protein
MDFLRCGKGVGMLYLQTWDALNLPILVKTNVEIIFMHLIPPRRCIPNECMTVA